MITSRTAFLILFLITKVFSPFLFTQETHLGIPQIMNFAKEDYRAGTQNWCGVQDDSGMMIFGNNKGVLLFDGTHWELLPLPNHTIVRSVTKGADGSIFIGGQREFGRLVKSGQGQIEYESLTSGLPEADRNFDDVWRIFSTEERTYFCTQRAIFVYESGAFSVLRSAQRFQGFFFVEDRLYVQEGEKGLQRWNNGRLEMLPGRSDFKDISIAAILALPDGLLIVSAFSGLFKWVDQNRQVWETEASSFLSKNQAFCALRLPNDNIAIGTAQNGLIVIDPDGKTLLHLNKASGLQNNTVLSVTTDRLNNYWLSLDNGIDYAQISAPFTRIGDEVGMEGTGYAAALYQNKLYLGTNQGVFLVDWPFPYQRQLLNRVSKLAQIKGQVWSISRLGEALIVNTHQGSFQILRGQVTPISPEQGAWKIMPLAEQARLAIEGGYTGLSLYENTSDIDGLPQWRYKHKIDGFDESARIMEQDQEGNIWISHAYKGLFRIRLTDDYQQAEVRYFGKEDGLPGSTEINVTKIKGEVLFTTPAGVYTYHQKSQRFTPYRAFNAVLGGPREIHRLLEDENEQLWFSIGQDFGLFDIQENGFLERPQMEQYYFNHLQEELVDGFEVVYSLDDRHTIIGTEHGFTIYAPQQHKNRDLRLEVLLREVRTSNGTDSVLYSENLRFEEDTLSEGQQLPSRLNALHFSYAAPFYEQLDQLEYRYWLKGYEKDWSDWDKRAEKEYTNLAQGDYAFMVQARNTYGKVSSPVTYHFTLLPPWYLSTLAKVLYFITGMFLLGGVFRYFSGKLEKERLELEAQQAQDMAAKEAEFRQEQVKSEEEIDRLRNERLQSDIQHRNSQLASSTMHLVQKGEVLLKIKKELTKVVKQATTEDNRKKLQKIIHTIDGATRLDSNWEQFEAYFDQVHENFLRNLRDAYPELTPKDQKLCAYLRMNLATKEIAPLMNISVRGVEISRYRLRKKLDLDTTTNLTDFIMRF